MAKCYFYYSAMNAGKSTVLLQANCNYRERVMRTIVLVPELDDRYGQDKIASRISLYDALSFHQMDNLLKFVPEIHSLETVHCVLVDKSQFLTKQQVYALGEVADQLNIPALAYGLWTDFQGNLFEGSQY